MTAVTRDRHYRTSNAFRPTASRSQIRRGPATEQKSTDDSHPDPGRPGDCPGRPVGLRTAAAAATQSQQQRQSDRQSADAAPVSDQLFAAGGRHRRRVRGGHRPARRAEGHRSRAEEVQPADGPGSHADEQRADATGLAGSRSPCLRTVDPKSQFCAQSLAGLSGEKFDRCYAKAQLVIHMDSVAMFEAEAERGQDPEVKALAAKALPHIKHHLATIKPIAMRYEKEHPSTEGAAPAPESATETRCRLRKVGPINPRQPANAAHREAAAPPASSGRAAASFLVFSSKRYRRPTRALLGDRGRLHSASDSLRPMTAVPVAAAPGRAYPRDRASSSTRCR